MISAEVGEVIVSATVLGSLYALAATGLSLVWGTLRIFNFAYGAMMMAGAYVAWAVADRSGSIIAGLAIAVVVLALLGVSLERVLVRPFLDRPGADVVVIITTLAGALLLQYGAQLIWGPRPKRLERVSEGQISIAGLSITGHEMIIILLAPAIMVALAVFLKHTRVGLSIRAVEQNPSSARLAGISIGKVYSLTFAISGMLAGVAGVMLGAIMFVTPSFGTEPLIRAFIVVLLGGIGSLSGTVLAAYLVGLTEAVVATYAGIYWTPVVLFLMLIVVLAVRPRGLLGQEA
jgi:branched-chain amino acid transport system permease protein